MLYFYVLSVICDWKFHKLPLKLNNYKNIHENMTVHCVPDNAHICRPIFFIFCTEASKGSGYRMNLWFCPNANGLPIIAILIWAMISKWNTKYTFLHSFVSIHLSQKILVHSITTTPGRICAKYEENRPTNVDIIRNTVHSPIVNIYFCSYLILSAMYYISSHI